MIALVLAAAAAHVGPGIDHSPDGDVAVAAFWLDREPVTNREFRTFLAAHPEWRRDRAQPLVVDDDYLTALDSSPPGAPVVQVSWFAASAYCAARGGRLPREAEWELAAAADAMRRDASGDPAFEAAILDSYSRPTPKVLPELGGPPNAWGVRDLHGVVWEWIEDFTASTVASDCATGARAAADPRAYARFLRASFRGALEARFGVRSLGFRCAYDEPPQAPRPVRAAARPVSTLYDLALPLRDANGDTIAIDVDRGHTTVMSMFYGSCPAACPAMIDEVSRIAAKLPDVRIVLVSFDPARDTPERLRELAREHHLDARWTLASARPADARALAAVLGIRYRFSPRGDITHTVAIVALDADGRQMGRITGIGDESPLVRTITAATRR